MSSIAGIDGCHAGWLRVEAEREGGECSARIFRTAAEALEDAHRFHLIAIDIPIGLPEDGPRSCDQEARRLVGPRRASVFPSPVRAALDAASYAEASELSRAACGKALSKQTFAILPKIREVDAFLRASPSLQPRIREVHPEVCFYLWNGATPLAHPKRHPEGLAARRQLAETVFPGAYDAIRAVFPRVLVADDDILDALAALWGARRAVAGLAVTLPAAPPRDRFGLSMEMLA